MDHEICRIIAVEVFGTDASLRIQQSSPLQAGTDVKIQTLGYSGASPRSCADEGVIHVRDKQQIAQPLLPAE
jgi:hypothetical protein